MCSLIIFTSLRFSRSTTSAPDTAVSPQPPTAKEFLKILTLFSLSLCNLLLLSVRIPIISSPPAFLQDVLVLPLPRAHHRRRAQEEAQEEEKREEKEEELDPDPARR